MRFFDSGGLRDQDLAVLRPASEAELASALAEPFSPCGWGSNCGDAAKPAAGHRLVSSTGLEPSLEFDAETGLLTASCGLRCADLERFLLPLGFCLSVLPENPGMSLGSAVATNARGRNHSHVGGFENFVAELWVWTPLGLRSCSRSKAAGLFQATVGGLGLTGCLVKATLQVRRLPSMGRHYQRRRLASLEDVLVHLGTASLEHEEAYAWLDNTAKGRNLGRGLVYRADNVSEERSAASRVTPGDRARKSLALPDGFSHPVAVRWANQAKWLWQGNQRVHKARRDALSADSGRGFALAPYGKRGFLHYACSLPDPLGEAGVEACLRFVSDRQWGGFGARLQRCGDDTSGLPLCRRGWLLAMDLPLRAPELARQLDALDDLILLFGGRVDLSQDARLSPDRFRAMHPEWKVFMQGVREVNPQGHCRTALSERLGLWENPRG